MTLIAHRTWSIILFAVLAFTLTPAGADSVKSRLFANAYLAKQSAADKDANEFAPKSFNKALKTLESAEEKYSKGKTVESIDATLKKAVEQFQKAQFASEIAQQKLSGLIKARHDAIKAKAQSMDPSKWKKAERNYTSSISILESGNQSLAFSKAKDAQEDFRNLELTAIKAKYLDQTRTLMTKAEKAKAKKYAPKTLAKAQNLLAQAEKALTENRYDIDEPRSLAKEANYEARHAIFLTKYLKEKKEKDKTDEDLILEWESPLQQVAAAADIQAEFDKGYQPVANEVIAHIDSSYAHAQEQQQDINDRDSQILSLNQQVGELSQKLGGVASAEAELQRRLLAQEKIRQKVKEIESTFSRFEATVFRDSDQIYIRLAGLSFASGSSTLKTKDYKLLQKAVNAIKIFPQGTVVIEGHTDSFGGDDMNLILSEKRALSVKEYMMTHGGFSNDKVDAVGYGETRPVANNETPQGRAKNRRIDIRIAPNLDLSAS